LTLGVGGLDPFNPELSTEVGEIRIGWFRTHSDELLPLLNQDIE